jgi:NAD-dependent dihydropyrimidine dehydrogenase PreA subunit
MGRTKITINYLRCGDGVGVDPRECGACLRVCAPAVFLLHQTLGAVEPDPLDPKHWRVTPMWTSLCTQCMKCVTACPEKAIALANVGFWRTKKLNASDPGSGGAGDAVS